MMSTGREGASVVQRDATADPHREGRDRADTMLTFSMTRQQWQTVGYNIPDSRELLTALGQAR
ncbi:hypothetical protein ACVWWN_000063 [Mycobacterium sp. URHB0021]